MENQLTDWERVTCSRCGGSGTYSYCAYYGTTCFKCAGQKTVLTKRAQVAYNRLKAMRQTPVADLVPGMKVKVDGYRKALVLQEIKQSGSYSYKGEDVLENRTYYIDLVFAPITIGVFAGSFVEVSPATEEERVKQVREAIAYQNTLTKTGVVRKRSGTKAA